jgi:hypothetical protein
LLGAGTSIRSGSNRRFSAPNPVENTKDHTHADEHGQQEVCPRIEGGCVKRIVHWSFRAPALLDRVGHHKAPSSTSLERKFEGEVPSLSNSLQLQCTSGQTATRGRHSETEKPSVLFRSWEHRQHFVLQLFPIGEAGAEQGDDALRNICVKNCAAQLCFNDAG